MNQKFSAKAIQRCLWMGAMILSTAVASAAGTELTFQVDMTSQVTNGTFTAGTPVSTSGTFNGWGEFGLTNNPAAPNTNLYTGTFDDTNDAVGGVVIYKYVTNNSDYESTWSGNNRCAQLPAGGGSLLLPLSFFDDAGPTNTVNVTFQVDMAEQTFLGNFDTNAGDTVTVSGYFNGWDDSADTLTNVPTIMTTNAAGLVTSNVYVGTFAISGPTNGTEEYKYVIQPAGNYEAPTSADSDSDNSHNRFFIIAPGTLPIVSFSDVPYSLVLVTNSVTFEVDMTTQIEVGNFNTNNGSYVEIHGDFDSWGAAITMTNNDDSSTPNIYSTVIVYSGAPNAQHYYKYVIQPGTQWETDNGPDSIGGNRWFNLTNSADTNLVEGPVYFSDEPPSSLIDFVTVTNCMVTFTVDMTNAVGTDGVVFDGSGDPVYLNGLNGGTNNSFWTWGALQPTTYQMNNIPGTDLYTITLPVNQGQNDELIYKYSINGADDEAGFGDNHERWIRSLPDYTMPVDVFGSQGATTSTELPAGDLSITNMVGNNIQVTWLGRRGVQLQTTTNYGTGWTPLPLTDGTNLIVAPGGMATTNFAIGSSNVFYRLVGPD